MDNSRTEQRFHRGRPTLGIFAKQPVPGQVKTRLCPPLQPLEACRLYQTALLETVERLSRGPLATMLVHTGDPAWFHRHCPGIPLLAQSDGDLGHRLQTASKALFAAGFGPVLLCGSDSPDLPLELVGAALSALDTVDLVTIPCRDGGYALIGLRAPHPEIFQGIPWSTGSVLSRTRQRARDLQLAYTETDVWEDLDDLAALWRLPVRSPDSQTAAFIRNHLGHVFNPGNSG